MFALVATPALGLTPHVPFDNNNLTTVHTLLLLSLIFVQDLFKLNNPFKGSRIRIDCQEMGSYESNKCGHPMYFNERRHRT